MTSTNTIYSPFNRTGGESIPASMRSRAPGLSQLRGGEPMIMTSRSMSKRPVKTDEAAKSVVTEPETLVIRWSDDYDILSVHRQVLRQFKTRKDRKEQLEKKLIGARLTSKSLQSVEALSSARIQIADLEREISKLDKVSQLDYFNAVNVILQEYQKLATSGPVIMGKKQDQDALAITKKTELVDAYFNEARLYCSLDVVRDIKSTGLCRLCSGAVLDHGDQYICIECNSVRTKVEAIDDSADREDISRKDPSGSGGNFRDFVMQFTMTFPVSIPVRILDKIRAEAQQYTNFDIKTQLTKIDLVRIMKDLHLGAWYKHLNKIYYLLTDKMPADISQHVPNVIRRGALLNEIYIEIKSCDRSNFLHGLHLLWLFLKNEGCEPNMADFVLLKSRDVELANLETLQKGFEILRKTHPEFAWNIYEVA